MKIQKRVRIWIAKKIFKNKKLRHYKAIKIQTKMRVCLAKAKVARIRAEIQANLDATVTLIQKNARRMIVRCKNARRKAMERRRREQAIADGEESDSEEARPPVSEWIDTYGRDAEYGLKRNRRITEKLFRKMLHTRYVRFKSKRFGILYLDSYPPKKTEDEVAAEMQGKDLSADSLTVRTDFASFFLPPFEPTKFHRKKAIELINKYTHFAIIHLPTSIEMRGSVDFNITTIQCLQRQRIARKEREKLIRVHKAIALFQRIFRRRYEIFTRSEVRIASVYRMFASRRKTRVLLRERRAATVIAMAWRCSRARFRAFDKRCVDTLSVLKSLPDSVPFHGPEKCLEHHEDTFWIAESNERAEIRIEFKKVETITEIWIMTR